MATRECARKKSMMLVLLVDRDVRKRRRIQVSHVEGGGLLTRTVFEGPGGCGFRRGDAQTTHDEAIRRRRRAEADRRMVDVKEKRREGRVRSQKVEHEKERERAREEEEERKR